MGFWKELRERKVFRVAIIYAVTGWLLAQVAGLALPTFEAPDWVLKTVIFILLLGFPLSLILAWALELTPDGVRVAEPAKGQKRLYSISALLAVGIAAWYLGYAMSPGETPDTEDGHTSIAVLPFLDLSPEGDQDYFAQGIAEQLLDLLAKNTKLQVAARTSSFQFKSDPDNVKRIGELLDVGYLLEGSVRRDGDQVRITAQLIDTRSGYHEWSETYTRNMTGIFALQDEISREIADELETQFGLADGQSQDETRDVNPAAYDEYLMGRHLMNQRSRQGLQSALQHLRNATELDPDFAAAHAQGAIAISLLSVNGGNYGEIPSELAIAMAEPFVEKASKLAPESAETLAARGWLAGLKGDWHLAAELYKQAVELNPSYMDVVVWQARLQNSLNNPEAGFLALKEAAARDRLNFLVNANLFHVYVTRGQYDEALEIAQRFDAIGDPRSSNMYGIYYEHIGEYGEATRHHLIAMREDPEHLRGMGSLRSLLRRYGLTALAGSIPMPGGVIQRYLAASPEAREVIYQTLERSPVELLDRAVIEIMRGDNDAALTLLEELKAVSEGEPPAWTIVLQAGVARRIGKTSYAEELLEESGAIISRLEAMREKAGVIRSDHLSQIMLYHCERNDREKCLALFEETIESHLDYGVSADEAPAFDFIKNDPEYQALLEKRRLRNEQVQAEVLPVLCNFEYPEGSWQPAAEQCDGYIEQ